MSATQTVLSVLHWAADPDGPPPQGDLFDLEALLRPENDLKKALSLASRISAARLGLTGASFINGNEIGAETLCIAAAIGGAVYHPWESLELLRGVPEPPADALGQWAIHHGLVSPALAGSYLPDAMHHELLLRSPFTSILGFPPAGREDWATGLCEDLAALPDGRRLLVQRFAEPSPDPRKLSFRGKVMDAFRLTGSRRPLVVDIYETAVALYGPAWRERIRQARRILANPEDLVGRQLDLVLSVACWWTPLREIHRAFHDTIRERNHLEFHTYLDGIRFASDVARLQEELARWQEQ